MDKSATLPLPHSASTGLDASISSLNSVDPESSATSSAHIDTQQSKWPSTATSSTASPLASREASPTRPTAKTSRSSGSASAAAGYRSRKNSAQDPSPPRTRSSKSTSTHSTTVRLPLSAATTPTLPPPSASEPLVRAPVPLKPSVAADSSKDAPRWPVSPRLKSPPPVLNKPATTHSQSSRRHDAEPPAISVQRATPSPNPQPQLSTEPPSQAASDNDGEDAHLLPGMRTPARGPSGGSSTLETVQEVSQPNTPGPNLDMAVEKLSEAAALGSGLARSDSAHNKSCKSGQNGTNSESGSESGSIKTSTRRFSTAAPPPLLHSRQSSTTLKFGGGKGHTTGESSSKTIMVEEEEVNSIPRVALGLAPVGQAANGSLKTKHSSETIRPKKEKKKPSRKQPSVTSGTASSKADIFEAKVASAVEEANSSDSDETFVYDSNPPDASDRPRRYHSRTPSATSMVSQVDRNGLRSIHSVLENGISNAVVKKNMKFVNTYNSNGNDSVTGDDDGKGTGSRSNAGSARGTGRHHIHQNWRRNGHSSILDQDSPFSNPARSKLSGNASRQSSNPTSPRFPVGRPGLNNGKRQLLAAGPYDLDDTTTGPDDERTPLLLNGNRSLRSNRSRRSNQRGRDMEAAAFRQRPSFLNRFASCLVLTIMLLLVITGAIGFMFATSQPLTEIQLIEIENVLASEQELMMDVTVRAHNPNVVVVTIDSADLEVFAKSRHAGFDSEWWRHPHGDDVNELDNPSDDQLGDPPSDDKAPNMRLGSIIVLDSPLSFEGSFFQSGNSISSGELRLARPGNGTDGGSERWERILSDEFTLIIKGVLKYTLPLSQRVRSVAISGKTTVKPNSANDPTIRPNGTDFDIGIS